MLQGLFVRVIHTLLETLGRVGRDVYTRLCVTNPVGGGLQEIEVPEEWYGDKVHLQPV